MKKWMFFIALFCCMNSKNMQNDLEILKIDGLFASVPDELLKEILFIAISDKDWQKNFNTLKALIKVNKRFNFLLVDTQDLTNMAKCLIFQSKCVARPGYYYFRH